jgi:hypothetical protein
MNRRTVLKNVALMLGGALSAPTLMAMEHLKQPNSPKIWNAEFTLTETQKQIIAEVAEMILPKTDTPGAKDAGVPAFIEMMLKDCYTTPDQLSFLSGVTDLENSKFLELDVAKRTEMLKELEAKTKEMMKLREVKQTKMGDNDDKEIMKAQPQGLPFWRLIKELTLLGYFTSEIGTKSSFTYVQIPSKFEVTKLKPHQKAYAY